MERDGRANGSSVRTYVASSLATTPVEALLDVAARLRAQGFVAKKTPVGFALCFVSQGLLDPGNDIHANDTSPPRVLDPAQPGSVHAAVHAALGDLLEHLPFVGYVGRSVFHDQRVPEGRPGLVVAVFAGAFHEALDGATAETRHALLAELGVNTAAPLLADGSFCTARFVALNGGGGSGKNNILHELHEAGGELVGSLAWRPVRHLKPGVALLSTSLVRLVTATSHASRPLGPLRTVTAASTTAIRELDGRPALELLLADLPEALRSRIAGLGGALFCNFDVDDGAGSVLRTITGIDARTGAVTVAGLPRVGDEVAFSLRDQGAARDDLEDALDALEDALRGSGGNEELSGAAPSAISARERARSPASGQASMRVRVRPKVGMSSSQSSTPAMGGLAPRAPVSGQGIERVPLAFVVFSSTARDGGLFGAPLWDVTRLLSRFGSDIPVVGCSTHLELATFGRRTLAFSQSVVVAAVLPS
jgi:small ligand-binding sensory domain FIST